MDLPFLRFCTLFNLGVVVRLYGFLSFFKATKSLKFQRLQIKEDFDILRRKSLSGVAEQEYTWLYGKSSQLERKVSNEAKRKSD